MDPILDLNYRAWTARREGLTAIGSWVRRDLQWRPCMVLIRTEDEGRDHDRIGPPCIINLENAWMWSEEIGDARAVAHVVNLFLRALHLDPDAEVDHFRVISIVTDHLGDLLNMPPAPRALVEGEAQEPVAEVSITDHRTGRTVEADV